MKLDRLTELRKKHDLTQDDVANFLDIGRTTYAMYEQGNREMDYELLLKLADRYKVTLDYLFNRSNNPLHLESYTNDENEFISKSLDLYRQMKSKYF